MAGADRVAAPESLGERHDVGPDPDALVREPPSGAPTPVLHLVEPQQRAVGIGDPPGLFQVSRRCRDDAGLALDRFQDDGRGVFVHRRGEGCADSEVDEGHVARQWLERLAVGSLGGQGE
jgi:hypothetical protein